MRSLYPPVWPPL